ncbi:MAG: plasmid pRiA4b ORF-3 family protein [Methanobrevibacter sp.]|nr:plasmid pRiA4b ORF-3 family protein [Methanobrevibacter sp.]
MTKGYDVKVRLDDFRPLTWRDLIIPAGITFKDLDNVMKILWDFSGYHLSRFTFKDNMDVITNEFMDIDFNPGELNSKDIIIDEYFDNNTKIYWEYDYGDGWSFTIEVKKSVEFDKDYPVIKRFKGEYNPQDDIGGVWGLERLMSEDPDQLTRFDKEIIQMGLEDFKDFEHGGFGGI